MFRLKEVVATLLPLVVAISISGAAVDVLHRLFAKYRSVFTIPENSSTALEVLRSGKVISPLALEGLHLIGNSFSKLRDYHARGVRLVTLTHNCANFYADSALVDLPAGGVAAAQPY